MKRFTSIHHPHIPHLTALFAATNCVFREAVNFKTKFTPEKLSAIMIECRRSKQGQRTENDGENTSTKRGRKILVDVKRQPAN